MIIGKLYAANLSITPTGVSMTAHVNMSDDKLGDLGPRTISEIDPAVVAQVMLFVEQMLPMLSANAGFPVSLPSSSPTKE
jgi:hypothetical protein